MILIEKTDVFGWESAIRGMRNPMNSWEKSDSSLENLARNIVGEADFVLMKKLAVAGPDHGKFLRMVNVTMDITAPLYWWKEYDTYKVGTVANSCSTMHKIQAEEFTAEDFSVEHFGDIKDDDISPNKVLNTILGELNKARDKFLETKDKKYWWYMIQLLPSSYNQKRTVQLNYAVLKNIYHSRKLHKLDEWREFCKIIETLPYSELITD